MRAAIYARISRDKIGAGLGVDRQVADCKELAASLGWQVVETFSDNDISAYSGKPRPGYRKLLSAIRDGKIDAVICWHTDRLHRQPLELEEYVSLCDPRGVVTQTVKAGHIDLATPSGRLVARQLGAVARYEVEHSIERQKRARLQSAAAGKWGGGRRPFGYERDGVTIVEAEAEEIRRAADAILAGASLNAVTADLNARGVLTSTGRPWAATETKKLLLRARNAGLRQHQGQVIGAAGWPAILDEDVWRAVVARLTDPTRRTSPGSARRWLGSALFRCGTCGETVIAGTSTRGRTGKHIPAYRCQSRTHVVRDAVAVDDLVSRLVVARLSQPDAVDLLNDPSDDVDTAALHAETVVLRQRLGGLATLYAEGSVDARQLAEGSERLHSRLADIERLIADATSGNVLADLLDPNGDDVAARWGRLDLSRKRAVIDTLLTVTIKPTRPGRLPGGGYFDPTAIGIEWKQ